MAQTDIAAVKSISDTVHGPYTEDADVYADRQCLYPAGCWLLDGPGMALGYLVTHPWRGDAPPALNAPLIAIPTGADRYYLHDLALLSTARGTGAAGQAIALALDAARTAGFARITLTAVNGADAFWRKQGFVPMPHHKTAYGEGSLTMERKIG